MSYITWYNIYTKAWFDAEAVANIFLVELSDIVLTGNELKELSDLIELDEYKDNKTLYMNLKCFNRTLNTSKRNDIHYFKDWFKHMIANATTPERSQEIKFHKIYINAEYEQENNGAFRKLVKTDPNKHALVDELECRIQNLLVGLGYSFIPSDTSMLTKIFKNKDDQSINYLHENNYAMMFWF
ncbi:MAG: hypothetical protein ACKPKO_18830, partial [Candidatus Fonsibacter sp.]